MTMQRYPNNPIEARKAAVRKYSRNAAVSVAGGVAVGAALGLLLGSWSIFIIMLVLGVVGGVVNYSRVQKIVNHRDEY